MRSVSGEYIPDMRELLARAESELAYWSGTGGLEWARQWSWAPGDLERQIEGCQDAVRACRLELRQPLYTGPCPGGWIASVPLPVVEA